MATLLDLAPRPWAEVTTTLLDEINEHRLWGIEFIANSKEPAIWLTARPGPLAQHERVVRLEAWPLDDLKHAASLTEELGERGLRMLQRASLLCIYSWPFLLHEFNARGLIPKDGPVIGARAPIGDIPRMHRPEPYGAQTADWCLPDLAFALIRQHGPYVLLIDTPYSHKLDAKELAKRWKSGDRSMLPTNLVTFDADGSRRMVAQLEWAPGIPMPLLKAAFSLLGRGTQVLHHLYATGDLTKLVDPTLLDDVGIPRGERLATIVDKGWDDMPEDDEDEKIGEALIAHLRDLDDKEVHDLTVAGWLDMSTELLKRAATADEDDLSRKVAPCVRDARVLQFRPEVVHRVFGEVQRYVDKIAKQTELDDPKEQLKLVDESACAIPFPDPLPFTNMFIGWGPGIPLLPGMRALMTNMMYPPEGVAPIPDREFSRRPWKKDADGIVIAYGAGILISGHDGGRAYLIVENHNHKQNMLLALRDAHDWFLPAVMMGPWLLAWFVAAINANDLVIDDRHALRRRMTMHKFFKKFGKRPLPRPWYMVTLHPGVLKIRRTIVNSMPREWRHRWDVIGHDVRRVLRGDLPLSERDIANLRKRKYRIFTRLNPPDADALEVLMRVDELPPAEDEWVAVQKVWRRGYVKGPEDKPYVPSVHALRKKHG